MSEQSQHFHCLHSVAVVGAIKTLFSFHHSSAVTASGKSTEHQSESSIAAIVVIIIESLLVLLHLSCCNKNSGDLFGV